MGSLCICSANNSALLGAGCLSQHAFNQWCCSTVAAIASGSLALSGPFVRMQIAFVVDSTGFASDWACASNGDLVPRGGTASTQALPQAARCTSSPTPFCSACMPVVCVVLAAWYPGAICLAVCSRDGSCACWHCHCLHGCAPPPSDP